MNATDIKITPQANFKKLGEEGLVNVTSDELFKGRTVVLFSLPGAFTPTCSSAHLPRYDELTHVFKARGVDEVICLSVNDAFTMQAWGDQLEINNVTLLADGNAEFTEAMGMLVDKQDLGFGKRSWRYSMLVRDGIIEKMFIEPEVDGDPFEVSDAETMLRYLDPGAEIPKAVTIVTRMGCGHCKRAKHLLAEKGMAYQELILGSDLSNTALIGLSGAQTVPQVFIDGKHIGGADDLEKAV